MARTIGRIAWLLFVIGGGAACSSSSSDSNDAGIEEQYVVLTGAPFANFCSWSSAPATSAADGGDGIHGLGPLTVYWNEAPPHGSTTFPEKTIIVKANQASDPTQRTIFAMVKRGAGFNTSGAVGWEWFSLQQMDDTCSNIMILWHGVVPMAGETYTNTAAGDCNGCHAGAVSNDYVWDSALQLTNF